MITRMTEIDMQPTVEELAREWCDLDGDSQREFFNWIGVMSNEWGDGGLSTQCQYILDAAIQRNDQVALFVMRKIGEYSNGYTDVLDND